MIDRRHRYWTLVLAGFAVAVGAQTAQPPAPLKQALVTRSNGRTIIEARAARPLWQAIVALRSEYGWLIDYEDPIYSGADLMDDTDPHWRAQHPTAPGVTSPAGEKFTADIADPGSDAKTSSARLAAVTQLTAEYGQSGNPGSFTVVDEGNKRLAVVGVDDTEPDGLFGVTVEVDNRVRSVADAINVIFSAVSQKVGKKVGLGFAPVGLLMGNSVQIGSSGKTARQDLASALDGTHANLVWEALYDADLGQYMVNIYPAVESYSSVSGKHIQLLIRDR